MIPRGPEQALLALAGAPSLHQAPLDRAPWLLRVVFMPTVHPMLILSV